MKKGSMVLGYLNNFNYAITGNGQKRLVFLHGLMGYGSNWRTLAKGFERDFTILLLDQRGHGKSFWPPSGYAPEDYAEDLKRIAEELGWRRFYLVGHSMGGRNALNFTHRFPELVEKLVIVDIGPESDPQGAKAIEDLLVSVPAPFSSKEAARLFFQDEFLKRYKGAENPRTIGLFLYSNLVETDGKYTWKFSVQGILDSVREGRASDRWHEIKALTVPTLIIRGENSRDLTTRVYEQMLASNPILQGVEIAGAGHWVHSDRPEEVKAVIQDFFSNEGKSAT